MVNSYHVEQSNKVKGLMISLIIHAALILVFLFLYLTPPDPPLVNSTIGGGGVDLNYGDPLAGTHDLSNLTASSPDPQPENEEIATNEPVSEPEPTQESTPDDGVKIDATETPHEDAVAVKVTEKETVKTEKVNEKKKEEPKKDPTPSLDKDFSTLPKKSGSTTKSGEEKNTPGDPGQKNGTEDGLELKGNPGKGGKGPGGYGFGGGLTGWKFVSKPEVKYDREEKGTLFFYLVVDEEGYIVKANVTKVLGGISPKTQAEFIKGLVGSQLSTINSNQKMPPQSTGILQWELGLE